MFFFLKKLLFLKKCCEKQEEEKFFWMAAYLVKDGQITQVPFTSFFLREVSVKNSKEKPLITERIC